MTESPDNAQIPKSAQIIVVGGGIIGCSVAYHLAKRGVEVLLLERHQLTSGSTWHAAGLVGQLRTSANITRLLGYSVELYEKLEAETGYATGWKRNGGLRLACNADRWIEVKRQATTARSFGLDMQLLGPKEAQALWPLMNVDDVVGAAFLPTDGQANPSDITQALAKGARLAGARFIESIAVSDVVVEDESVKGVITDKGTIACEKLVLCCGLWTQRLAARAGVTVPLAPVHHQYILTERIDGVTAGLPTLRDPDRLTYYKEEVGGLVMGGYEPNPIPWSGASVPEDFAFRLLSDDWDHFEPIMNLALGRVPALGSAGVKQMINGLESFTPDGNWMIGEAPEVRNFFVGAGFNAFGIASAGGAGMALAEWVADGEPPYDLWPVDIRRFGAGHERPELGAHPHAGGLCAPLLHRLAGGGISFRAAAAPLAALRAIEGPGRLLWREDGFRTAQLVRRRGRDAAGPLFLHKARLVRRGWARASRLPERRRFVRSDQFRQGDAGRTRRGERAVLDRGQ